MKLFGFTLFVSLSLLGACATLPAATVPTMTLPEPAATETPARDVQAALMDVLGNLTYNGILPDQQITLADGYADYKEAGLGRPYVRLIDHLIAKGDLDGDGAEDAAAFLVDNTTGSGDFVFLVPVLNVWNKPTPVQALLIGDRIPVKSLVIEGGQVIAEIIALGPGDPSCCPTWNVRKIFNLEDGRLVEHSNNELGKVSVDDLNGSRWRLVDLNLDQEPVLPETEITLSFDDGQISGSAGCNLYKGVVGRGEDLPQSFSVDPIAATSRLCSDPISTQETNYLTDLDHVVAWRYDFGYLSLTYKIEENVLGELLFVPMDKYMTDISQTKPNFVTELETAYGAPSQAGFGSAVFYAQLKAVDDLEKAALEKYKYFVGDLWERYGEDAWMGSWKEVYTRKAGVKPDIVAELRAIQDPDAAISVPMILDNIEGADKARAALRLAYDDPTMTVLQVFNIGDGGAMSGLLIAGRHNETGDTIFLVFLLD